MLHWLISNSQSFSPPTFFRSSLMSFGKVLYIFSKKGLHIFCWTYKLSCYGKWYISFLKKLFFCVFIFRIQKCSELFCTDLRQWQPTPVLLPGKSHGQRNLVGYSPWGHEELDRTDQLHFHFSLSCIGEGNGNPLQCSCLENPRDGSLVGCCLWGRTESNTTNVT